MRNGNVRMEANPPRLTVVCVWRSLPHLGRYGVCLRPTSTRPPAAAASSSRLAATRAGLASSPEITPRSHQITRDHPGSGGACLFAADGSLDYEYSALLLRRYTFKVGRLPPSSAHVKAGDYPRSPEMILDCPRLPEIARLSRRTSRFGREARGTTGVRRASPA